MSAQRQGAAHDREAGGRLRFAQCRAAEKTRDLIERALRGRQPDALQRCIPERLEPLEREHEVRPALGRHERVNLVDDDGVDRAQRLARLRCQQQEQRLGRGDQDVGRLTLEARALASRRVARPHGGGGDDERFAAPACEVRNPGEGARRFRSTSTASALSGETYSTRQRSRVSGTGANIRRSIAHRNAASVLPLPVGANTRVDSPRAIAGHPRAWAAVGASKDALNQSRTAGWNDASGSAARAGATPRFYRRIPAEACTDPRDGADPREGEPV